MVVWIYILTHRVREFPFLYTLSSINFLYIFSMMAILTNMMCYLLYFSNN